MAVDEPEVENAARETPFSDSELVIGIVAAVGANADIVTRILKDRLGAFTYQTQVIKVSTDIISQMFGPEQFDHTDEFARVSSLMDAGNKVRRDLRDSSILGYGMAAKIGADRQVDVKTQAPFHRTRRAYIVDSLKRPEEIVKLREIYPNGFYLVGVHADLSRRRNMLIHDKRMSEQQADFLISRDEAEGDEYGQRTSDSFHMSDFFVHVDEDQDRLKFSIWRVLDILFGCPFLTPTFDEYAMFMAFSASVRSADLSRQVGAVIAKEREIISTGANDCPRFGGGLYWPEYCDADHQIKDAVGGRDCTRGYDANKIELQAIIEDALCKVTSVEDIDDLRTALESSRIADITEFGRVVHAEMEAVLSCARNHVSTAGATLYCTTFPCHNCAKHIVAAGIKRVVYVEPYPKSKAAELHGDSITLTPSSNTTDKVLFEPFVGVGPRRFFDLFSMRLGSGYPLRRKDGDGKAREWNRENARLRVQMLPTSYLELEQVATSVFDEAKRSYVEQTDG